MAPYDDPPGDPRQPTWAKQEPTVPGLVAAHLVLAHTDNAAVTITGILAYRAGFEFTLSGIMRHIGASEQAYRPVVIRDHPGSAAPDFIRLALWFSDGRVATNLGWESPNVEFGASGPVLVSVGGGGGGRRYDMRYWVWPLPPTGPMTFVCQGWPAYGIDESRGTIDGQLIRDAAARSIQLWPEDSSIAQP